MKTLLIYGVDTIVGANIAPGFCEQYHVIGVATEGCPEIGSCQILSGEAATESPEQLLSDLKPDYVVDATCCGDSAWNPAANLADKQQCQLAVQRACACKQLGISYTLISSDAIFSGPWMFHEEDSQVQPQTEIGMRIHQLETDIRRVYPSALIARTHPFGWNILDEESGWIENLLMDLHSPENASGEIEKPGYATPIIVSELGFILARAFEENLTGTFHICGAERVNRQQFACRLAELSHINWMGSLLNNLHYSHAERSQFGCGEMSLQTRNIRKALCVAMPTLSESIAHLLDQQPAAEQQLIAEQQFCRAA